MGAMPISAWRPVSTVTQTLGAASVSTTAAPAGVHAALFQSTGDCHVRWGPATQTAVATDMLIRSAYPPLVFAVTPGDVVAVIQDAAATGTLFITWLTH
jgi:hypothetical protein